MELFKELLASYGFPIFVAVYLLVVMNKTIKANTDAINKLNSTVEKLCNKVS